MRVIRTLSACGLLVGTVSSAGLPALLAATDPEPAPFHGPRGPGHLGGAPARQRSYSRLTSTADAQRVWGVSQELTGVTFPGA